MPHHRNTPSFTKKSLPATATKISCISVMVRETKQPVAGKVGQSVTLGC